MELLFGYGAGLLTLINPCVLPVLPLILGAAASGDRRGPLALAAGMSLTFVVLGVSIAAIGPAIGLDSDRIAQIGAGLMIAFGLILLVPSFNEKFATAAAGLSGHADRRLDAMAAGDSDNGLMRQFLTGALLGAAWSPCIGPTLGGAISLAAQGKSLGWSAAIMLAFALGTSTVILALAYGAREAIMRRKAGLQLLAEKSKTIMAAALIIVGVAILFGLQKRLEIWAIEALPLWLQDLSVSL